MKKIAILTGGPGFEKNIALKSVKLFEKYISREYETFILPETLEDFIERKDEFDLVIPVFHGEYGEDGKIQALLELYNIPYVGSNYFTNALCMNKREANAFAHSRGLKIPGELYIKKGEKLNISDISFDFPVIIKPNTGGSSYYTYKIGNFDELKEKLSYTWNNIDNDMLIQEYILGDEYSVSVVNGGILDAIMYVEKNNEEDFFDYESKYESESGMKETFPDISSELRKSLTDMTQKCIDCFSIRGYARIDFIVRNAVPYFLEVNTIPGSTEVSILPKAWKLSGRGLEEFVETLIVSVKK